MRTSNYFSVKLQHPGHNINSKKIIVRYFPINPHTFLCLMHNAFLVTCLLFIILYSIIIFISVFCPRAGPSLQAQEPRLQFC